MDNAVLLLQTQGWYFYGNNLRLNQGNTYLVMTKWDPKEPMYHIELDEPVYVTEYKTHDDQLIDGPIRYETLGEYFFCLNKGDDDEE